MTSVADRLCTISGCTRRQQNGKSGICKWHADQQRYARYQTEFTEPITLLCSRCKEDRDPTHFARDSRQKRGYKSFCYDCATPETVETRRDYFLRSRYGISLEAYESMLEAQGNVCAICKQPEKARATRGGSSTANYAVDHDHSCCPGTKSCGKCVRGILCRACNHGLGNFRDRVDLLDSAKEYLTR